MQGGDRIQTQVIQINHFHDYAEIELIHSHQFFLLSYDRPSIESEMGLLFRSMIRKHPIKLLLLEAPPLILQVENLLPPAPKVIH